MNTLPTKEQAQELLEKHVPDTYQRLHALMVATAVESYAKQYKADAHLWWLTGYLHDLDFGQFPDTHPTQSLAWFREWNYPEELIHAVEAHALGFNGFTTEPQTDLARVLIACDEISGIFYAYQKLNPIPFGEMKAKSIVKRVKDKGFAPKIDREHIYNAVDRLGIDVATHAQHLIGAFSRLD